MSRLLVAAFYAFTPLDDTRREALLETLPVLARDGAVLGSVLVANEGVNGTISGPEPGVHAVLAHLRTSLDLGEDHYARLEVKRSWADQPVFRRFKARRKEIVTIGISRADPSASVGTYVDPQDWNALVDDPDTLVIDTRNSYETAIGTFDGAIDPGTESFVTFPSGPSRPCGRCLSSRASASPCSAPAASAARRPAATCSRRASGRRTTCARHSGTSSRCRKARAATRNALSSINGWR